MSIKPLDEIPMNTVDKRRSYREMIRQDIQTAIDQRITKFEFEGDYNWKYLAQYAREEADGIWRSTWYDIMRKAKEEHGIKGYMGNPSYHQKRDYIRISSVKMEDRMHVYCQIDYDAPERICRPLIEEAIQEQKEKDAKAEAKVEAKDLSAKIIDLGFTLRTRNVLLRAGVNTMADLQNRSRESLMRMRNMGAKGVEETVAMMERFGIEVIE
jgi:hypothetical protein